LSVLGHLLTIVTVFGVVLGGHFDVVKLLVEAGADVDSQDNRKVFCLMAAFRKVHMQYYSNAA